jgi:hypothetical protein
MFCRLGFNILPDDWGVIPPFSAGPGLKGIGMDSLLTSKERAIVSNRNNYCFGVNYHTALSAFYGIVRELQQIAFLGALHMGKATPASRDGSSHENVFLTIKDRLGCTLYCFWNQSKLIQL